MALSNAGFDGTVNELFYARSWALGAVDAVDGAGWLVTQGVGRQVSVAAGIAFARGIVSENTAPITLAIPTPASGQWFYIVRRVNWATNSVSVEYVAGPTTSTAVPTVAPSVIPTLNDNPGVLYDQRLGWAWVNSANLTMVNVDQRQAALTTRLATVERFVVATVASGAERDALIPNPVEGNEVFRSDVLLSEKYRAGSWRFKSHQMVGQSVFAAVSVISLDGIFNGARFLDYEVEVEIESMSASNHIAMTLRLGGADSGTGWFSQALYAATGGAATTSVVTSNASQQQLTIAVSQRHKVRMSISNPAKAIQSDLIWDVMDTNPSAPNIGHYGAVHNVATAHDGLKLICVGGGTMTGRVTVLGKTAA